MCRFGTISEREETLTSALREGVTSTPRRVAAGEPLSPARTLHLVLDSLRDSKSEDIVSIDIAGKSPIGDHMVVASGRSHRHVGAITDKLVTDLKAAGGHGIRVEGKQSCDWVLVDTGDVIVHVFRPEVRDFYGIEKMWRIGGPAQPTAA